jgi:hypothetical protein
MARNYHENGGSIRTGEVEVELEVEVEMEVEASSRTSALVVARLALSSATVRTRVAVAVHASLQVIAGPDLQQECSSEWWKLWDGVSVYSTDDGSHENREEFKVDQDNSFGEWVES